MSTPSDAGAIIQDGPTMGLGAPFGNSEDLLKFAKINVGVAMVSFFGRTDVEFFVRNLKCPIEFLNSQPIII